MTTTLLQGDAAAVLRGLADRSAQCCVTSPPYYGLRDYHVSGQLGREDTPGRYVDRVVHVCQHIRRVLHPSGTLWLVLGDSYSRGYCGRDHAPPGSGHRPLLPGCRPKELLGIPWLVALALKAEGWLLRSDIVWSKPNCMTESVRDRPTRSHEYVFLLARQEDYYWDWQAVREDAVCPAGVTVRMQNRRADKALDGRWVTTGKRNCRSVWNIPAAPSSRGEHFATFPGELARRCILAGTSEKGCCPACGCPWVRQVGPAPEYAAILASRRGKGGWSAPAPRVDGRVGSKFGSYINSDYVTTGWNPSCSCGLTPVPCIVLDPFMGSGTTGLVAKELRRSFLGIDLNPDYVELARQRIEGT